MAKAKARQIQPLFWVNDKSDFYWEVIGPDGKVHGVVRKDSDESNRYQAQATADRLNREYMEDMRRD